eukprot:5554481-Prymnesium_polylepis.2
MAPQCASCDPEVFRNVCQTTPLRQERSFRPPSLRSLLLELADSQPGRRPQEAKEAAGSGGTVRLRTVYTGMSPAKPRARCPSAHSGAFGPFLTDAARVHR